MDSIQAEMPVPAAESASPDYLRNRMAGVFVPISTPFLPTEEIDFDALIFNLERYAASGVLGYPSKMLLCSVRPGPYVNGKMRFWDIEEFAGGDIVYTLPPYALEPLYNYCDDMEFSSQAMDRPVPQSSLYKVMQVPYGIQGLDPNGLSLDQFNTHPATILTVAEFSKAANGLEDYVTQRLVHAGELVSV